MDTQQGSRVPLTPQVPQQPQVMTSPLLAEPVPLSKKGILGRTVDLFTKKPTPKPSVAPVDGTHIVAQAVQGQQHIAPAQPIPQTVSVGHPEVAPGNHFEIGPVSEIEIIPETPEVSAELAEHVEAVERQEITLPEPIDAGVMAMPMPLAGAPTLPKAPNIILPVTKTDFQAGAKQPVNSSWRWLVEWVKWIIKKHPGQVLYRS